jgi:hypothetical protein
MKKFIAFGAIGLTLGIMVIAGTPRHANADTPTPSPTPQVTSDLVVVMDGSYLPGDLATISLRNDGNVAYRVPLQPECNPKFKDSTGRAIVVVSHCDVIGDKADPLDPGESIVLIADWPLTECTEPGFSCGAIRPLPTGDYTVFGSLDSVDGQHRAEYSKTVSITGPHFTSDIELSVFYLITDPPLPGPIPVYIELRNKGQVDYTLKGTPGCYLRFLDPAGHSFSIPPAASCDDSAEDTISPGEVIIVVGDWKRDECTEFGPAGSCVATRPLASGNYVISGALYSADKQSYAEFTFTMAILAATAPSPTAKVLPDLGGPSGDAGPPVGGAVALAFGVLFTALGGFVISGAARSSPRSGKR